MKRLLSAILLLFLLALPLCASAESAPWICEACGQEGNTGNFCPNCGAARPAGTEPETETEPEPEENLTQIPGETDWVSVDILRVDGSDYIPGKKDKYQFAPWDATDGKPETCWQFSVKNAKKKAPWLSMVVEGGTVDGVWIRNGYQAKDSKGKDQYPLYARLKDVRVVFVYNEKGKEADTLEFTLTDDNPDGWEKLDTGRREGVYAVDLEIVSAYRGKTKPNNACMSEILLVQNTPAEQAKEPLY